jgi:ribosome biogenesis GTPase A
MVKPLRVLVCGIPNVGKSTLINTLMRRKATKTGDEAGITKTEQVLSLASDVILYDTPGMLWPRITVPQSGLHLGRQRRRGRNAYDEQEVALALLTQMLRHHADRLRDRYKLGDLAGLSDEAVLADIGRKRAPLLSGGLPHMQKAAEIAIHDFRSGAWGPVTLETLQEFTQWQAQAKLLDAEREARRAARSNTKNQVPPRGQGGDDGAGKG